MTGTVWLSAGKVLSLGRKHPNSEAPRQKPLHLNDLVLDLAFFVVCVT